jgi:hypothetical protein
MSREIIVSDKYKLIYYRTFRTGSTSIIESLGGLDPQLKSQYLHKKQLFPNTNYFKLISIRNPWDRLLSTYLGAIQNREPNPHMLLHRLGLNAADQKYDYDDHDEVKYRFTKFVNRLYHGELSKQDRHFQQQFFFVPNNVDYVCNFEILQQAWKEFKNFFAVPPLKHHNRTSHLPAYRYYDNETFELIRQLYTYDIRHFGYDFNNLNDLKEEMEGYRGRWERFVDWLFYKGFK